MPRKHCRWITGSVVLAAMLCAAPAAADVKAGVEAWSRGDYAAAVREWQGPAQAGDPDAMFNLAQAYRLGRGTAVDLPSAEALYAKAAAAGHLEAADTYGLMLFQDGRREAALPYVKDAAHRGDPRSQYLLGIAHFNGDIMPRDWVRAYALVSLASAAGLPQAPSALAEMDNHIPLPQRQQAASLAQQLRAEADAARATQLAAVDLGARSAVSSAPASAQTAAAPRPARPTATTVASPSIAAARAAVAEASRATGTESPATAGASYARPGAPVVQTARAASPTPAPAPRQVAQATPAPTPPKATVPATARAPTPAIAAANGPWRIQLGAFSVAGNAQKLWDKLSTRSEIAGKQRLMIPAGNVTKLQAGGYASRDAADSACRSLQRGGQDCLVTQR